MAALSAAARFITACVREPDAADLGTTGAPIVVHEWNLVVETAARHRVLAYVQAAAARGAVSLPANAEATVREQTFASVAMTMRLNAVLVELVERLRAAAVPLIVLKGPALARTIYPAAALRPYGDLDLVVDEQHEAGAVEVLLRFGLVEVPCGAEENRRTHAGHVHGGAAFHRLFLAADGQTLVELHVDPLQLGLKPTGEKERWRRAVPIPQLPGALMLCPEDQMVQLSIHAHKHGFDRLIWLKDLDLLLRTRGDGLDWDLIVRVARQEGVRASVWYGLGLARTMLGAPVPSAALQRLRPGLPIRLAYRLVWPKSDIEALDGHMRRRAVQFHGADSWRGMLPGLVLMGRRRARLAASMNVLFHR